MEIPKYFERISRKRDYRRVKFPGVYAEFRKASWSDFQNAQKERESSN